MLMTSSGTQFNFLSFPTQGYFMVQMAAGTPAFLSAIQEGGKEEEELPTESVHFEDDFLPSFFYSALDGT